MWQFFKHLVFPSHCLSRTPLNPKSLFTQTPLISSKNLCKISSMYVFLNIFFTFVLNFVDFSIGFSKFGDFFEKGLGSYFCEKVFKILIGLSPICCVCIYVGPMWQSDLVLRHFHSCSCIVHWCCALLHAKCLIECPSDILMLNWTLISSNSWVSFWLNMLDMFWSMGVCFTHIDFFVPQCLAIYTLCTH